MFGSLLGYQHVHVIRKPEQTNLKQEVGRASGGREGLLSASGGHGITKGKLCLYRKHVHETRCTAGLSENKDEHLKRDIRV